MRIPLIERISFYLIFGFLLSLFSIFAFYLLAQAVFTESLLLRFDRLLSQELYEEMTPQSIQMYQLISLLGLQVVYGVTIVLSIYYIIKRQWLRLGVWISAIAGGFLLNQLLKSLFDRPRPVFANPIVVELNASFPSGHAMMSVVTYGLLAYFLMKRIHSTRIRIIIVFASVLIAVLIGISRMTLGVHYFSDVIAGYFAGTIWLTICVTALEYISRRRNKIQEVTVDAVESR
jgi:membrane-associated phospholipid phosphatase